MRQAVVSVRDRDGTALGIEDVMETFREAGITDVEVLSCEGSRTVVRFRVAEAVDEVRLESLSAVTWWEQASVAGEETAYVVEFDVEDEPNVVEACDEDLLLCGDIDVTEEGFTYDVAGPQDAIADTIAEYENAGANVGLETLRDYQPGDRPLDGLTPRQREVLEVAYDMGFFDVPREASTDDVAAELDLDDSTVAEHLQRAERNLLSSVLG